MAQIYVTGPAYIFVNKAFLGTAVRSPSIEIQPTYEQANNTIAGTQIGLDQIFQGEHAWVRGTLSFWDRGVYGVAATRGTQAGALTVFGKSLDLIVMFPKMGTGYHFPIAHLYGPDHHHDMGTIDYKLDVVFHALPKFAIDASFVLYDTNMSGVAAPK